jgi:site-specific DNA-methyltransferase (adenine-specific)
MPTSPEPRPPDFVAPGVRLYCGDCLEILPELEPGSVDAVVTDPPYGIFCHGGKWGKKFSLEWDRPEKKPTIDWLLELGSVQVVWGGNYFALPPSRGWLVWMKRDSVETTADCELAWTSIDMNTRLIDQTIAATNPERCGHPTQKPLRVMEWTLDKARIPKEAIVFDPFMGSGTTGVACLRTGRSFIGIEKEPKYFDLAVRRIKAELNRHPLFEPPVA